MRIPVAARRIFFLHWFAARGFGRGIVFRAARRQIRPASSQAFDIFILPLTVNDCGELLSWMVTPGNCDDRKPVTKLARGLWGKLFGDKGYLSNPLKLILGEQNLELVTNVRKNMKPVQMSVEDKIMLRKRSIIETVIDQLKNISQIKYSRHHSFWNFLVNLVGGLIAYSWREKKPTINYFVKGITVL